MFGVFASGFAIFFAFVVLLIAAIVIFMIVTVVRRTKVARTEGLDPLAGDIQVMGAVRDAAEGVALQAHAQSNPAERLQELDALLAGGKISSEEHAAQRARILGSI